MLPFAVLGFIVKPLQLKGMSSPPFTIFLSQIILVSSEFQSILINAGFGPAESEEPLPEIETASLHAKGAEISVISANSLRITNMGLYCFLRLCFEKNLTKPSTSKYVLSVLC